MVDYNRVLSNIAYGGRFSATSETGHNSLTARGVTNNSEELARDSRTREEDNRLKRRVTEWLVPKNDSVNEWNEVVANVALASAMQGSDYLAQGEAVLKQGMYDALNWAGQKLGAEARPERNFLEEYRNSEGRFSGQKVSEYLFGDDSTYAEHKGAYDFIGDMVVTSTIVGPALKAVSSGGKAAQLAAKAGLSPKWVNRVFINSEATAAAKASLAKTVEGLAKYGGNPSTVANAAGAARDVVRAGLWPAIQTAIYGDAALYASGYARDRWYPEGFTSALKWAPLSIAIGAGGHTLGSYYSTSKAFSRGAAKADQILLESLNAELAKGGADIASLKVYDQAQVNLLNGFGIGSASQADAITANTYLVKALENVKSMKLAEAAKSGSNDIQALANSYDKVIAQARANVATPIRELASHIPASERQQAVTSINNALRRYSNVMVGTTDLQAGPKSQLELDSLLGHRAETIKALERKAAKAKASPEDPLSHEALEKLAKATEQNYQLIDQDGFVYNAIDYHLPWRDDERNLLKVRYSTESLEPFSKGQNPKAQVFTTRVGDNDFANRGRRYNLEARYDGSVVDQPAKTIVDDVTGFVTKRDAKMTKPQQLFPTDSGAYDASWYLLGKQYDSMFNKVKDHNGREAFKWQVLAQSAKPKPINLALADHMQVAYLAKLGNAIDSDNLERIFKSNLERIFKFENRNFWHERGAKLLGKPVSEVSFSEALNALRYEKTKEFMAIRFDRGAKSKAGQLDRYSEDSLMTELTGFTTADEPSRYFHDDQGASYWLTEDVKNLMNRFVDNDPFHRPANHYVLQKTSEVQALYDAVNNEVINRLAEDRVTKMQILSGELPTGGVDTADSLVSSVTRAVTSRSQYQSGYLTRPNALALNTALGDKFGSKLFTQDFRNEANAVLQASVGFSHELDPIVKTQINAMMSDLVEKSRALVGKSEATSELGRYWHQASSGFDLADDFIVSNPDGTFSFALSESEVNNNVAQWAKRHSGIDYTDALSDGLMPDPFSGKPLKVSKEVADLVLAQHELNLKMYDGDSQLAAAFGRAEPQFRNGHMPSRVAQGKAVRIIGQTNNGTFQPEMYVFAATEKEAEAMAKLELTKMGVTSDPSWSIKTSEAIHMNNNLFAADIDKNFMNFADYTDVVQQMLSKGERPDGVRTSRGNIVFDGDSLLRELIEVNNTNLNRQAGRARKAVMYDAINKAKAMLGDLRPDSAGYNELNEYIANLTGNRFKPKDAVQSIYDALDDIIDMGGEAISEYKMLPDIYRAQQLAEMSKGEARQVARFFKNGDEAKALNGMSSEGLGEIAEAASRSIQEQMPVKARSAIGAVSKITTDATLFLGNLGYALMNLVSLPAVAPMVRASMRKLPNETKLEYASRTGAWSTLVGNGDDIAIDLVGGLTETLNTFQRNKELDRKIISEAKEMGIFTSQASLINEVFSRPSDAIMSKAGNRVVKAIKSIGEKSEELSRIWTFKMGYHLAMKQGLEHSSAMSFAKRFMDNCVGNYAASNRPAIFQNGIGGLFGLFYTYNHNVLQQYLGNWLRGDKLATAVGLATQSAMFGTKSLYGADTIEKILLPISDGKSYHSALVDSGFTDSEARAIAYGGLAAATGINFGSKGVLSSIAVPGTVVPPAVSLGLNLAEGAYEAVKQIATDSKMSPDVLWEIAQTRMPVAMVKASSNLLRGYKVDRNHNLLASPETLGNTLWWASSLLSIPSVDESLQREAIARQQGYNTWKAAKSKLITNNLAAALRNSESTDEQVEYITNAVKDYVRYGGSPEQISSFVKAAYVKAELTPAERQSIELARSKNKNSAKQNLYDSMRLAAGINVNVSESNTKPAVISEPKVKSAIPMSRASKARSGSVTPMFNDNRPRLRY